MLAKPHLALMALLALLASFALELSAAPLGAAFTYQGRLTSGTNTANGSYDFTFAVFDAASSGSRVGGPLTNLAWTLSNGCFTASLDFGSGVFSGEARWLEIAVRTNGGGTFAALSPRQALLPAPHALYGAKAGSAATLTGVLPNTSLAGTYAQPLAFSNAANQFSGNGSNLTSLNASQLTGGTVPDARLSGNVAWRSGGNTFTGNQLVASGNVGVGTGSPTRKLQVTETLTNAPTYPAKLSNEGDTTNTAVGLLFQVDGGGDRGKGALAYERTGTWNRGSFHFLQNAAADTSLPALAGSVMTIANNGCVGIGTQSPAQLLQVGDSNSLALGVLRLAGSTLFDKSTWQVGIQPLAGASPFYSLGFVIDDAEYGTGPELVISPASGNVGIGTSLPEQRLDVQGTNGAFIRIDGGNGLSGLALTESYEDRWILFFRQWQSDNLIVRDEKSKRDTMTFESGTGRVGIGVSTPGATLDVEGNVMAGNAESTFVNWRGTGNNATFRRIVGSRNRHAGFGVADGPDIVSPVLWMYSQPGNAFEVRSISYNSPVPSGSTLMSVSSDGVTHVQVLEIQGGADVAEPFPMSAEDIPAGAVVVIDDQQPGRLKLSDHPYDRRVVGVVSGANGIRPGLILQQEGLLAGGRNVALTGRVYAQAEARSGPIEPGDLLTTSDTPGHAMKALDPARTQGSILGKAMSRLQSGKGMVLVLVSLQ